MKRRWLFGILFAVLGVVALFLALAILHLKRNQDIDPPDFSDLAPQRQPVPDEENAYLLLLEASQLYVKDERELLKVFWEGEAYDEQELLALFEANQPAIAKIHEALKRNGYWHEVEYSYETLVPEVSVWMALGNLMQAQSEWLRRQGQFTEATYLATDLNRFGLSVGGDGSILICQLVGVALAEMGAVQSRRIVRDMDCPSECLLLLEISLRGSTRMYVGFAEALRAEFTTMRNTFLQMSEAPEAYADMEDEGLPLRIVAQLPLVWGYLLQPNRSMQIVAEEFRPVMKGLQTPWEPLPVQDVDEILPFHNVDFRRRITRPNWAGELLLGITLPAIQGATNGVSRVHVSWEATRVLIALRLFELSEGVLPQTLEQLVPTYLNEVPVDPFSGQPFRYDREWAVIWSIGKDRVDQGGSVLDEDGKGAADESRAEDQVYSLRKSFQELVEEKIRE